ncbi:MAG: hypothetical protein A2W23_03015 [Planctomycetes bacterium RBG_16_43_13]|nr:MAG: hypothetical protein A2W23_03015 [Planctomycetes bacterium RBG_16_43_13]
MTVNTSDELAKLCEDYWQFALASNPPLATYLGEHKYDDRLQDIGPDERARELKALKIFLSRLNNITISSPQDRITLDILKLELELSIEGMNYKSYQWSVDQMGGPQVSLFELINFHPFKTDEDYRNFTSRLRQFERYMNQYIDNLKEGVGDERVSPKIAVTRVIAQLEKILSTNVDGSPLCEAIRKIPDTFPATAKTAIKDEIIKAISEVVNPSYRELLDYLKGTYLAKAREDVGLWAIKDGAKEYEYRIRLHTADGFSAKILHQIGLDELASIEEEMKEIGQRLGLKGDVREIMKQIHDDKRNYYSSGEEILTQCRAVLAKADKKLPAYFGKLPRTPYEVKPIESYRDKDAPAAFYYPPPADGSRNGIFYANTYKPETRPKYSLEALAYHEAVPGHHLQCSLSVEQKDIPAFRRHGGFTAFVEGWALYTERLADEMGLYSDDLSRFGMLSYQAWRACRLVVDTSIHYFKWTRQQAIDFICSKTALKELEVVNEVDRYIIWPGQALAYKVGQREIMQLRTTAQKTLGNKFDVREFHDYLLENGGVPLDVMKRLMNEWIGNKKGEKLSCCSS